jgi:hypothetical protein
MSPSSSTPTPEQHELHLYKSLPTLIDRAFKARERAVSHRAIPFKVGAAALVCDRIEGKYAFLDGANYKPYTDGPRKCAEEEILEDAEALGVDIIGMVVVAPHQPDDHTGIDLGVTPCCTFCRKMIRKKMEEPKPHVTKDTRLVFVNAGLPTTRVELSVQRMLDIFNGKEH